MGRRLTRAAVGGRVAQHLPVERDGQGGDDVLFTSMPSGADLNWSCRDAENQLILDVTSDLFRIVQRDWSTSRQEAGSQHAGYGQKAYVAPVIEWSSCPVVDGDGALGTTFRHIAAKDGHGGAVGGR